MAPHRAAVFAMDARGVPSVIDMPMGQEQMFHRMFASGEPLGRILRSVDQDPAFGQKKAVGVKNSAGKCLDLHVLHRS